MLWSHQTIIKLNNYQLSSVGFVFFPSVLSTAANCLLQSHVFLLFNLYPKVQGSHLTSLPLPHPTPTYTLWKLCQFLKKHKFKKKKETLGHFTFSALNKKYFSLRYTATCLPQKDPRDKDRAQKICSRWASGRSRNPRTYVEMFLSQRKDFISS